MSHEQLTLKGTLEGHNGWVTQIATNHNFPNMILSASRGFFLFLPVLALSSISLKQFSQKTRP